MATDYTSEPPIPWDAFTARVHEVFPDAHPCSRCPGHIWLPLGDSELVAFQHKGAVRISRYGRQPQFAEILRMIGEAFVVDMVSDLGFYEDDEAFKAGY